MITVLNIDADTVRFGRLALALVRADIDVRRLILNHAHAGGNTHVVFARNPQDEEIRYLSSTLGEDCIAAVDVWDSDDEWHNPRLLGPRAAQWLPFNPAFFTLGN